MAGIQLSGLASGFDWKSVVDQLMALQRLPQDRLRTNKSENINKLTSFTSLRSKVTALQTAAKTLSSDGLFSQRAASLADTASTWNAAAANGSVTGAFTFNVSALATKTQNSGTTGRAANLNATNDVSALLVSELRLPTAVSEGVFTVNGEQITIAVTDTLQEVFDKISTATGTAVTATYNAATDRVSLAGTGAITLGSGVDTSNFLYALKLYNQTPSTNGISSATDLGAINLNEAIAGSGLAGAITAVDGSGNGSFEINGTAITYNVNTDSLQAIIDRVNDADAGVTLSYDTANDRFRLTNETTGDLGLSLSESAGGLLGALGLSSGATVRGTNAVFSVNGGGTIVSASNTFDPTMHGLKGLTVTADSTGSQKVTVTADTASLEKGIRTLIEKFNDVQTYVDEQTKISLGADGKVSSAQFAGNREFTDMARTLRGFVFDEVPGVAAAFSRLASIGIDFNGSSSQLAVRNDAALTDAIANHRDEVTALFTKSTSGITAKLDGYLTNLARDSGIIDTQENTLETRNKSLDKQITDIDRRLTAERLRMEAGFIRMEQAQSLINSQLASLKNL